MVLLLTAALHRALNALKITWIEVTVGIHSVSTVMGAGAAAGHGAMRWRGSSSGAVRRGTHCRSHTLRLRLELLATVHCTVHVPSSAPECQVCAGCKRAVSQTNSDVHAVAPLACMHQCHGCANTTSAAQVPCKAFGVIRSRQFSSWVLLHCRALQALKHCLLVYCACCAKMDACISCCRIACTAAPERQT